MAAERWYKNRILRNEISAVLLLIAAHIWLGLQLVDGSLFLTPDGADYLIGARSLATGNGYIDLSDPNPQPRKIFRPIGMSVILSPIVGIRGYDVRACEYEMIGFSAGSCILAYLLLRSRLAPLFSLGVLSLLCVSPVTLIHASEVFSETPFLFFVLLLLLLINGSRQPEEVEDSQPRSEDGSVSPGMQTSFGWMRIILILLTTIAAEKTRALGLALWPALFVWALAQGFRWRLALFFALAALVSVGTEWLLKDRSASTATYLYYLHEQYQVDGVRGIWLSVVGGVKLYLIGLLAAIAPSVWPGLEYFQIGWSSRLPSWLTMAGGLVVLILAGIGVCGSRRGKRLSPQSQFLFVFVMLAIAMLLLWPRMSRLLYPVMFLVTIYFWIGIAHFRNTTSWSLLLAAMLFHGIGCYELITEGVPPKGKWSAIAGAGRFLAENSQPHEIVITTAKDLFLFSHRFQIDILGHSASIEELNRFLIQSGSRFLVILDGESDPRLQANPAFLFTPVYRYAGDAVVWSIAPNRSGRVHPVLPKAIPPVRQSENAKPAAGNLKEFEEQFRQAREQRRSGNIEAAAAILEKLLANHQGTDSGATEAWIELANAQVMLEKPIEALASLEHALSGSYADLYLANIRTSQDMARKMISLADPNASKEEQAIALEGIALGSANAARWLDAASKFQRAIERAPNRVGTKLQYAKVLLLLDRRQECDALLASVTNPEKGQIPNSEILKRAGALRLLLQGPDSLKQNRMAKILVGAHTIELDPNLAKSYLVLGQLCWEHGLFGLALEIQELGVRRFPKDVTMHVVLGSSYAAMGQWENGLKEYQLALALQSAPNISKAVKQCEEVLNRKPRS